MRTTVHLFAGGCGDLRGFADGGHSAVYAANHAEPATATARANWPGLRVEQCDINNLDMRSVPAADGLVGSPICTESTPAGGHAAPRLQASLPEQADDGQAPAADWTRTRMTAWDPIRYAEVHRPAFYAGENVPGFATRWPLFGAWLGVWDALGYCPVIASVNAAHISGDGYDPVPQYRDRLVWAFIRKDIARRGLPDLRPRPAAICTTCGPVLGVQQWGTGYRVRQVGEYGDQYRYVCPNRRCGHAAVAPVERGIGDVIDHADAGPRFGDGHRGRPYVTATRARVEAGLRDHDDRPFVVTLRRNGGARGLDRPIGTLSAQGGNHHYLVTPTTSGTVDDCGYRPLTLAEKAAAQGFPPHHILAGTEAQQRLQIGNAVPVNVARWLADRIAEAL